MTTECVTAVALLNLVPDAPALGILGDAFYRGLDLPDVSLRLTGIPSLLVVITSDPGSGVTTLLTERIPAHAPSAEIISGIGP